MIELRNLSKSFYSRGKRFWVFRDVNVTFPTGESVALLGRNGAGKSTLLSILAGSMTPDRGQIITDGTISWPIGYRGSFHGELTGAQNVRFIARVYGVDTEELVRFVAEFADIGERYEMPVRTYSSGMRAKLGFGLSMGIRFDTYLVDESTAVGDATFREKARAYFMDRMANSSSIFVSHGLKTVRQMCTAGAVLEQGRLVYYDDVSEAIAHHEYNMNASQEDEDFV